MLFYFSLILILLFLTGLISAKENDGRGLSWAFILLIIIGCIRFDVGSDYSVYYRIIDETIIGGLIEMEPFSLFIASIAIKLDTPSLFFVITSLIAYTLSFLAIRKNSVSPAVSLIVYVGIFYLISLSIVRQAVAMGFCLYAYKFIKEKSFFKYLICIVVATLFHYSALICLVIYPIYHILKFWHVCLVLICLFAFRGVMFSVMMNYGIYGDYLSKLNDLSGGSLTRIFYILLFLSFPILIKKKFTTEEKKLLSIILVGIASPFLFGAAMGARIGYYFLIYYCYAIPLLLQRRMLYKRYIYVLLMCGYFLAMVLYTSNIPGQKSVYVPYQTIFNSNRDFRY